MNRFCTHTFEAKFHISFLWKIVPNQFVDKIRFFVYRDSYIFEKYV